MRRTLQLLLWPGALIVIVLAVLGVHIALFAAISNMGDIDASAAQESAGEP